MSKREPPTQCQVIAAGVKCCYPQVAFVRGLYRCRDHVAYADDVFRSAAIVRQSHAQSERPVVDPADLSERSAQRAADSYVHSQGLSGIDAMRSHVRTLIGRRQSAGKSRVPGEDDE